MFSFDSLRKIVRVYSFRGIFYQNKKVITYLLHSQTHITIILCVPKNTAKTEHVFQNQFRFYI